MPPPDSTLRTRAQPHRRVTNRINDSLEEKRLVLVGSQSWICRHISPDGLSDIFFRRAFKPQDIKMERLNAINRQCDD